MDVTMSRSDFLMFAEIIQFVNDKAKPGIPFKKDNLEMNPYLNLFNPPENTMKGNFILNFPFHRHNSRLNHTFHPFSF